MKKTWLNKINRYCIDNLNCPFSEKEMDTSFWTKLLFDALCGSALILFAATIFIAFA